jgi:hypothetical protein
LTLDVEELLGEYWWSVIDWHTGPIELTTEHLSGDGHLQDITSELTTGVQVIDVGGSFENLDDGLFTFDFKDLTFAHFTVSKTDIDDLGVPR